MEYHEAEAWFELGRRWVRVDYRCAKPASPVGQRKEAYDSFLQLAAMLSVPINTELIPSPVSRPSKFVDVATEVFKSVVVTPVLIARGETATDLLLTGSLYMSTVFSARSKSAAEAKAVKELHERMRKLGVAKKDSDAFVVSLRRFIAQKKPIEGEYNLASTLGKLLATSVAKSKGIQIGDVTLPNTILLPSRDQITLPKRLVGYKDEIEVFLKKHPYERNVFLMMAFRDATKRLRTSIRSVCAKFKLYLVIADEQRIIENDLNSNVLACLLGCKYGIAVFSRPESQQMINPNVAYELGMMHREDKICLILKDRRLRALPTDLISYLYTEYSAGDRQSLVSQVELWIQDRVI